MHAISTALVFLLSVTLVTAEIFTFGANGLFELGRDTGSTAYSQEMGVVNSLSGLNIVSIASSTAHSLILTSEGHVYSWGYNGCGAVGDGTTDTTNGVKLVAGLENIVAISAGDCTSSAITNLGELFFWGDNRVFNSTTPSLIAYGSFGEEKLVALASSGRAVLAVTDKGELHAWGDLYGNEMELYPEPALLTPFSGYNIVAVAGGEKHIIAKTSSGQIMALGYNSNGQLGDNSLQQKLDQPAAVYGLTSNIVSIYAGCHQSLALTDGGELYVWGTGYYNLKGIVDWDNMDFITPTKVEGVVKDSKIVAATSGCDHILMLTDQGKMYSVGFNDFGQLGNGTINAVGNGKTLIPFSPIPLNQAITGKTVTALGASESISLVATVQPISSTLSPSIFPSAPASQTQSPSSTSTTAHTSTGNPASFTSTVNPSDKSTPHPSTGQNQSGNNNSKMASGTTKIYVGLVILFTSFIGCMLIL
jgi:alpha-tubulin suppressor-like RCC1 family protein